MADAPRAVQSYLAISGASLLFIQRSRLCPRTNNRAIPNKNIYNVLARVLLDCHARWSRADADLPEYVDSHLIATGQVAEAAIIGLQGGVWATSKGFTVCEARRSLLAAIFMDAIAVSRGAESDR